MHLRHIGFSLRLTSLDQHRRPVVFKRSRPIVLITVAVLALACCTGTLAGCSSTSLQSTTTSSATSASLPAATTAPSSAAVTIASASSTQPTTAARSPVVDVKDVAWELVSTEISSNFADMPPQLVADPATPTTLYVATSAGLLRSIDSGSSWATVLLAPVESIVAAPSSPSVLYASTPEGVVRSADQGSTWGPAGATGLPEVRAWVDLKLVTLSGNVFVSVWCDGDGSGVYRSENGGRNWTLVQGLPDRPVPATMVERIQNLQVLLLSAYSATIQAETAPKGVFWSTDEGRSWALPSGGWAWSRVPEVLAISPLDSFTILGAVVFEGHDGRGAVFRTADGGQTWQEVATEGLPSAPRQLLFDAHIPNLVYSCNAGMEDIAEASPLHCSTDGGTTWQDISEGLPAECWPVIFANPAPESGIYAVTHNGLYKWAPLEE